MQKLNNYIIHVQDIAYFITEVVQVMAHRINSRAKIIGQCFLEIYFYTVLKDITHCTMYNA